MSTYKKLLSTLLCFVLSLSLMSCGLNSNKSSNSSPKAEETVSSFFNSLKAGDFDKAANYLDKSNKEYNTDLKFKNSLEEKLVKTAVSKVSYKILSSQANSHNAVVEVEITSPDLLNIYNDVMSNIITPIIPEYSSANESEKQKIKSKAVKAAVEYIAKTLNSEGCPKTTNTAKLTLYEQNSKWIIKPNEDFIYALTGKMPQLLRK